MKTPHFQLLSFFRATFQEDEQGNSRGWKYADIVPHSLHFLQPVDNVVSEVLATSVALVLNHAPAPALAPKMQNTIST